jgi:hypothetical protein
MDTLQAFFDNLDSSNYDCESTSNINTSLQ